MRLIREIGISVLEERAFAPFGRVVTLPEDAATSAGAGWECWYQRDGLVCPWPVHFGLVRTRSRPIVIEAMERHPLTWEYLAALGHDLIQPVAPPTGAGQEAGPDAGAVRAFRIPAGAAVILHPGTWHSAAFPAGPDTSYAFACMEPPGEPEAVWVPFADGALIQVNPG